MSGQQGILVVLLLLNLCGLSVSNFFFPGGARPVKRTESTHDDKEPKITSGAGYRRAGASLLDGGRGQFSRSRGHTERVAAAPVQQATVNRGLRKFQPVQITTARITTEAATEPTTRRLYEPSTTLRPADDHGDLGDSLENADFHDEIFSTSSGRTKQTEQNIFARENPKDVRDNVAEENLSEVERPKQPLLERISLRREEAEVGQGRRVVKLGHEEPRIPLKKAVAKKQERRVLSIGDQEPSIDVRTPAFSREVTEESEVNARVVSLDDEAGVEASLREIEMEREEHLKSQARDLLEESRRQEHEKVASFRISQPRVQVAKAEETDRKSQQQSVEPRRFQGFRQSGNRDSRRRDLSPRHQAIARPVGILPKQSAHPVGTLSRRTEGKRDRHAADSDVQDHHEKSRFAARGNARTYSPLKPHSSQRNTEQSQSRPAEAETRGSYATRGKAQVYSPHLDHARTRHNPKLQRFEDLETSNSYLDPIDQDFLPTCPDSTFSYIIPSPSQCDLYYHCELGTPSRKLCEDGLVFSISQVKCVTAEEEDCQDRPLLQTPTGEGPCERANGIYHSDDTCDEFVTCRNNHPIYEKCADGLVFDTVQKTCAWADEALRPGCMPEDLLGFVCPNEKKTPEELSESPVRLRFGDHDRHADESDCRFFFMCLASGHPRRAGCGGGKVFDRDSGVCRFAKDVPECADYYGPIEDVRTVDRPRDLRIERVETDLNRQFRDQRSKYRLKRSLDLDEEAEPERSY